MTTDNTVTQPQDDDAVNPGGGSGAEGEPSGGDGAGIDIASLLKESPEAQNFIQQGIAQYLQESKTEAERNRTASEFETLIKEGNFEEIGRRFVEDRQTRSMRQAAADAATRGEYEKIYGKLFAQPEMKKLAPEDKSRLNPDNFSSDSEYVTAVTDFIAEKRAGARAEVLAEERMRTSADAEKAKGLAGVAGTRSASGLPGAVTGASDLPKSTSELIRMGLRMHSKDQDDD